MNLATCTTCHRAWGEGGRVVVEGGLRQPAGDPRWTAWQAWVQAWDEGVVIVAACERCGQPVVAAHGVPIDWTFDGYGFAVRAGSLVGATREEADRAMRGLRPRAWSWREIAPASLVLGMVAGPIALLVFGLSFISAFLSQIF